eukprot:CAMPEP_0198584520 /NCGR_PEP_ID=MMETSP1462-20131121/128138_1 /TAXON_ID=1333877 /ORGANISM="Brandtodinium nutriculum, Strain RCC3387" /LENGTH=52 /DNA_ID=CAMNT_0044315935 /DNA_START=186 /DNA_END=341 /DNA_ORIENTATION=-
MGPAGLARIRRPAGGCGAHGARGPRPARFGTLQALPRPLVALGATCRAGGGG